MKNFETNQYRTLARWLACELWDIRKSTDMNDVTQRRVVLEETQGDHYAVTQYNGETLGACGVWVYDAPSPREGWKAVVRKLKRRLRKKWRK